VRQSYEYAKAPAQQGNLLLGWFPENAVASGQTAENCGVSLMLNLAVKLSRSGAGDYWDDVDRWVRNHFAECQLKEAEWLYRAAADRPRPPIDPVSTCDDKVGEKNVGAYAGWPSPNDFLGQGLGPVFMHCCLGEACMTVYRVWAHILDHDGGQLKVNLLLNRASPWADIESSIPYQGRVELKIKQPCGLSVRIPEWVKPDQARCRVNGADRPLAWDGRYAVIGKVQPMDVVTLSFPIFERTDKVRIQGKDYTLIRKGNEVVHIDPPGKYCPLYQREKYRENMVYSKEVQRFVANQQIDW
jgi:DUF1680 family protein